MYISHVMVEVGPPTALAFLDERMIYSAIIIRLSVTFRNPLGSGMYDEILEKSGLTKIGVDICGDDTVH